MHQLVNYFSCQIVNPVEDQSRRKWAAAKKAKEKKVSTAQWSDKE